MNLELVGARLPHAAATGRAILAILDFPVPSPEVKSSMNIDAEAGHVGGNRFSRRAHRVVGRHADRRTTECQPAWRDFDDVKTISFAARALPYGVARMYIDRHLQQWDVPADHAEDAFKAAFDLFVDGVAHAN